MTRFSESWSRRRGSATDGRGLDTSRGARSMAPRGLFISIEGGEKAGKSTQATLLAEWLTSQGREVVVTREPGGTPAGEAIRQILLGGGSQSGETRLSPVTEALLFAAARAQHVDEVIRPALEAGKVVIADRYTDSSLAYQGYGLGLALDRVLAINEWATGSLWPDLTVLLDCPDPEEFGTRPRNGREDRIERRRGEFHRRVAAGYRELASREPERFVVVDGSRPVPVVAEAIRAAVREHISRKEVSGQ